LLKSMVSHVVPEQQPDAHDVPSHTHVPAEQRCPTAHGEPPGPQEQAPFTQRSPVEPQLAQAAPFAPQPVVAAWLASRVHVEPVQQPLPFAPPVVHVVAQPSHEPVDVLHVSLPQLWQAAPFRPHWAFPMLPLATQVNASAQQPEQPPGDESHLQTGVIPDVSQYRPGPQAGMLPH
jgi:hypothetical protein